MSAESTKSGKVALIRKRAELLHRARAFFDERGLIEVDVPLLVQGAPLDAHIDLFEVLTQKGHRYLHSSPEHGMKRLLAAGCPDCYQMSHVFRLGEQSSRHNPEFLMAEWYRRGWSLEQLMEETVALFRLFLGPCEVRYSGYWDLLTAQVGADLSQATTADLLMICKQKNIELGSSASTWDRTALIQLLFATTVEPTLGQETLDLVIDWPEDQAAHSRKILRDGRWVAQRFEAYYRGLELCNGYDEVIDPEEQRQRFLETNVQRVREGNAPYLLDTRLLEVLAQMPPCAGVAVGMDRVFQIAMERETLAEALAWGWDEA